MTTWSAKLKRTRKKVSLTSCVVSSPSSRFWFRVEINSSAFRRVTWFVLVANCRQIENNFDLYFDIGTFSIFMRSCFVARSASDSNMSSESASSKLINNSTSDVINFSRIWTSNASGGKYKLPNPLRIINFKVEWVRFDFVIEMSFWIIFVSCSDISLSSFVFSCFVNMAIVSHKMVTLHKSDSQLTAGISLSSASKTSTTDLIASRFSVATASSVEGCSANLAAFLSCLL